MSTVSYDGKKIQPAPTVEISQSFNKSGSGEILDKTYTITLTGTIVAFKGSPTSAGVFNTGSGYLADEEIEQDARLAAILRKQEALKELFSIEGKELNIQSMDGSQPLRCNPRVVSISFPAGLWFVTCDYTIVLEADRVYPETENVSDLDFISDANESWNIDTDEQGENEFRPRIYRLTHTVGAVGKRFYNSDATFTKEPWEHARDYVLTRLGFDSVVALSSGVNNLPSYYGGFNHTRSDNRDELGGSYSVVESWILASGNALEDFSVETVNDINSPVKRVSIQGSITGLEERDSNLTLTAHKYDNAVERFILASGMAFTRAQVYSGLNLNIVPLSERVARNPVTGTISYSYEFDNRPSTLISGALSEVISINDGLSTDLIAIIPVLGRAAGPVIQNLHSKGELSRQLDIEVVMPLPDFGDRSMSALQSAFFAQRPTIEVSGIINAVDPRNTGFSESYITANNETFNPLEGRYSRSITWILQ